MRKWFIICTLIILAMIVSVVVWVTVIYVDFSHKSIAIDKIDSIKTINIAPPNYSKLFRKTHKLSFYKTIVSKTRNPISQFDYADDYSICVYEINASKNTPLDKLVKETYANHEISDKYIFHGLPFVHYDIMYMPGHQDKISGIYLNIFGGGKPHAIIKNDTVAYYHFQGKKFEIKYQLNGAQDFFVKAKYEYKGIKIPMEVMVKRHDGKLYLIILSPYNEMTELKPGTLLSLIND